MSHFKQLGVRTKVLTWHDSNSRVPRRRTTGLSGDDDLRLSLASDWWGLATSLTFSEAQGADACRRPGSTTVFGVRPKLCVARSGPLVSRNIRHFCWFTGFDLDAIRAVVIRTTERKISTNYFTQTVTKLHNMTTVLQQNDDHHGTTHTIYAYLLTQVILNSNSAGTQ